MLDELCIKNVILDQPLLNPNISYVLNGKDENKQLSRSKDINNVVFHLFPYLVVSLHSADQVLAWGFCHQCRHRNSGIETRSV